MILVDTSAWIDFFRQVDAPWTDAIEKAAKQGTIVVGDLVLVEVLQGVRSDDSFLSIGHALARFPQVTLCDEGIARDAAAHYRSLRKRGITVRGTIDVVIATWCLRNGASVIHNDRDLATMERELGLAVYRR